MSARVRSSKWAILAEESASSDDDISCDKGEKAVEVPPKVTAVAAVSVSPPTDIDSVLRAMACGSRSWADLMDELSGTPVTVVTERPVVVRRRNTWDDFWALPFTTGLRELWGDCYDCSSLTETQWNDMMRWLHEAGWDVGQYDRSSVEFEEADGPRRSWIPPAELEAMLEEDAAMRSHRRPAHRHSHSHCHHPVTEVTVVRPAPVKKAATVVPRFCREGTTCAKEGCRYVHGDTIPRVNEPCAFGAECGSSDPTGLKRSQCLRMHPGEEWAEGLVVHRPTA
jgi:hypothetical protein